MAAAEAKAAAAGFGYLVLWTDDQQAFYASCGYVECESVTLLRPALATLGRASVEKLEALIASKASASAGDGGAESVARPGCTWMRKRLLESVGCVALDAAELRDGVRAELSARRRVAAVTEVPAEWALSVPAAVSWERQVGPCCGIAALRMARATLAAMPPSGCLDDCDVELRASASADSGSEVSILQEALQAGYSSDGELFDIHHLCDLAARCCALDAAVVSLASTAGAWEERLPSWLRAGGVAILPYDAEPGSHSPCERNGQGRTTSCCWARRAAARPRATTTSAWPPATTATATPSSLASTASVAAVSCVGGERRDSNAQLNEVKPGQAGKWVVGEEGCGCVGACCCGGADPNLLDKLQTPEQRQEIPRGRRGQVDDGVAAGVGEYRATTPNRRASSWRNTPQPKRRASPRQARVPRAPRRGPARGSSRERAVATSATVGRDAHQRVAPSGSSTSSPAALHRPQLSIS